MHNKPVIPALVLSLTLLWLVGCSTARPTFVDDNAVYTADSAIKLLESSNSGELADAPFADTEKLRQEALSDLRRHGGAAREAAKTITRAFSNSPRGVPYYVERIRYGKTSGWLLLEAAGRNGGKLSTRRLWVVDAKGNVLLFGSR